LEKFEKLFLNDHYSRLVQHDYQRNKQITAAEAKILDGIHLLDNLPLSIL